MEPYENAIGFCGFGFRLCYGLFGRGGLKPRPSDLVTLHLRSSFPGPFALQVRALAHRMGPRVCLADPLTSWARAQFPGPRRKPLALAWPRPRLWISVLLE